MFFCQLMSLGYVALSVFCVRWEERKGPYFLLDAYLNEFTADDDVVLYILTSTYRSTSSVLDAITTHIDTLQLPYPSHKAPPIVLLPTFPTYALPSLYKSCGAFVLPTRGEGFGRPIVEAMSMSLPVIVTNWSGPTQFMTELNSYPLQYELSLVPTEFGEGAGLDTHNHQVSKHIENTIATLTL